MSKGNGTTKRRKKQGDIEEAIEQATPKPGGNGFDPALTQNFVERIENLHDEIASIMMNALTECKAVHADIKIVYQEAKDEAGIPKKALKRVIKARSLERKASEVREELEGEDQDNFDLIRQALGDLAETPLGQATMASAKARAERATVEPPPTAELPPVDTSDAPFAAPDEPRVADPN